MGREKREIERGGEKGVVEGERGSWKREAVWEWKDVWRVRLRDRRGGPEFAGV